jgi:hypothetical protein
MFEAKDHRLREESTMLNESANTQLAQQLANSRNRSVAIWTNSRGAVNIQFEGVAPVEPFNVLEIVVEPTSE